MKHSKEYFMKQALKEANKALLLDEVPIGAVIVKDNKIIARGFNNRENKQDVTSHAEIEAIKKANKKLNSWRLVDADIYVTIEPCVMCLGALIQTRIAHIYYGAKDDKGGAITSLEVLTSKKINHHPVVEGGILEEECSQIISQYFRNKRKNK